MSDHNPEREFRKKMRFRSIWIKRGIGRKAQWGRLTGRVEKCPKTGNWFFWAERSRQGGQVPLYRHEFVLKRAQRGTKFAGMPASGRVRKGKVLDRGKA